MVAKALAAAAALVLCVPVLFVAAGVAVVGGSRPAAPWSGGAAAAGAAEVPAEMWSLYQEAGAAFGVQPGLLAGVGKVECDHGRYPRCNEPNEAGAIGPMQFLPSTFVRWASASGSPAPDPRNPRDAVFAAAAKLAADGAASDPSGALFSYNHSRAYVATVEAWAVLYGWRPGDPSVLGRAVLDHPAIGLRPAARADVAAGRIDARVLGVLLAIATRHELAFVGPFVSGHSYYVAGTSSPSNHAFGRAVDIPMVDGEAVTPSNEGARRATEIVDALPDDLRPTEIGCPWADAAAGAFTAGHDDHLHFGFDS
jgi:hypothetical protein